MSEYDEFDEAVANHWAIPLLDSPHALVSVIETKIARATLGEQRRIIALIEEKKARWEGYTILDDYPQGYWDALEESIELIKGENE